jgi:hypothetical protein
MAMKIYKYWQVETKNLIIGKEEVEVKCYGGSNASDDDARLRAKEKIEKIQRKINGDKHIFDTYEAEIQEEIIHTISDKAIITRNRYGAQVLNVENIMIMDIDEPKFSLGDFFKKKDLERNKQRIIEMVRNLSQKPIYKEHGYRIYETQKGIRVIVMGKTFDPTNKEAQAMMKDFHCDNLYTLLCRKQGCFRARLTPKASRMNLRGHRVRFPRTEEEQKMLQEWLKEYEAASMNYSVCKFTEQIGIGYPVEAIQFHDEITGAHRHEKLA